MRESLPQRLYTALGNWIINRARRTPYFHLTNQDGSPYMDRYWLLRIGTSTVCSTTGEMLPWIGLRVHHIRSSDDGTYFHDHPWSFVSLILRGGYHEETPYDGADAAVHVRTCLSGEFYTRESFEAPALLYRRAEQWHRLRLPEQYRASGTWTLVMTLPKRQSWGFLVNGRKVGYLEFFAARARKRAVALMALSTASAIRAGKR